MPNPEVAKPYSITSSARASTACGMTRPSAFAVLRLTTSSYFVGASTGRSAGFSALEDAIDVACGAAVLVGAEHPDTAMSLSILALLLQARPLHERALAIREKVLGAEHPDTAMSLNNLASLLQAQGDLAGARPLYERALAIREKVLGAEHPDTATSLSNLGRLLRDLVSLTRPSRSSFVPSPWATRHSAPNIRSRGGTRAIMHGCC